jgi:hypothetical protein
LLSNRIKQSWKFGQKNPLINSTESPALSRNPEKTIIIDETFIKKSPKNR